MLSLRTAAATAGLLAALAAPLAAPAAVAVPAHPTAYHLKTALTDQYSAGALYGTMDITVYPDGIVQGSYRPEFSGFPRAVTGGLDDNGRLWLDIGMDDPLHLDGTLKDGTLDVIAATAGIDRWTMRSVQHG